MSEASAEEFLGRVMPKVPELSRDKFNFKSWRFENRPTSEGVGIRPGVSVDVEKMASRILDVEGYAENMKYVVDCTITSKNSDTDFVYIQRMNLPILGGLQCALRMTDLGERDGFRVVAWAQDDAVTDSLDKKKGGARTQYNLGAWLIRPDEIGYALSSAPRKSDVGSLKFAVMTKGANAGTSDMLKNNIDTMIAWSKRD
ncbi:MAG: hypothetical protein U0904_04985 [Candidatus Nanopelagicales bacterium]|nr:hypothetical protein [Candidatus Nanopelagicales bacterium]